VIFIPVSRHNLDDHEITTQHSPTQQLVSVYYRTALSGFIFLCLHCDLPSLPNDFDGLDSEEKEQVTNDNELDLRSKYYKMSSLAHNQQVYNAMKLDRRLWEPFTYCQLFSHGNLVPLRHCLIRLYQDWSSLGLPGNCPFSISENELQRHQEQKLKYEDRLYPWDLLKNQLSTDNVGWVPNSRWEATERANKELYNMYIEIMSEELNPQAAAKSWPFPPKQA
jgi:hypothetical protein